MVSENYELKFNEWIYSAKTISVAKECGYNQSEQSIINCAKCTLQLLKSHTNNKNAFLIRNTLLRWYEREQIISNHTQRWKVATS